MQDLQTNLGADRRIAIARELTKQYEEVWRGTLTAAIAHFTDHSPRGEFTLVIAGKPSENTEPLSKAELEQRLTELLQAGLSRSQASRQLAQETHHSKRDIYQIAIALPDISEEGE